MRLLLLLATLGCHWDLTIKVPCRATLVRDTLSDTVAVFQADSTRCPQ